MGKGGKTEAAVNRVSIKNNRQFGADRFVRKYLPLGALELPPAGTVHLWFLDLRKLSSPLGLVENNPDYPSLNPRHERTIRRFYLRLLLGAYLGLPGKDVMILRKVNGKPVLDFTIHRQIGFSKLAKPCT